MSEWMDGWPWSRSIHCSSGFLLHATRPLSSSFFSSLLSTHPVNVHSTLWHRIEFCEDLSIDCDLRRLSVRRPADVNVVDDLHDPGLGLGLVAARVGDVVGDLEDANLGGGEGKVETRHGRLLNENLVYRVMS